MKLKEAANKLSKVINSHDIINILNPPADQPLPSRDDVQKAVHAAYEEAIKTLEQVGKSLDTTPQSDQQEAGQEVNPLDSVFAIEM